MLVCLLCLPWCLAQQPVPGGYDVEGLYLQGYILMQDAEKLEGQKNFAGAYYKYEQASGVFDSVARTNPSWQTRMVNLRRTLIRKKMEEVRQRERDRRTTGGSSAPNQPPADLLPPLDNTAPPSPLLPPQAPPSILPGIAPPANAAPIDSRLADMQRQVAAYATENQRVQEAMQAKEAELFKVKQQLLENKQELNASLQKQIDLQNKVDTADQKRDRELGELRKQLEETTSALVKATQIQDEATTRIDELLGELRTARETITKLNGEKEALTTERNQMLALVQSKGELKGADGLIEENNRLKTLLDAANDKVVMLTNDKDAALKEASTLRDQIASMRDQLDRTQKENEDYRQQIAGLRTKLEETTEKLLEATPDTRSDPELADENRLLRRMILEQLKHQAYREQKKRLALEQLAKLQINNDQLLTTISQLAAPPPTLSPEETGLLQDPQMKSFLENQGVGVTLITRPDQNNKSAPSPGSETTGDATKTRIARGRQELPPELQTVAEAGIAAFRGDKSWEAERAFQTILKSDPTNVFALSNAAVAQVKQRKFGDAEKNLKKALAYQESDAFSHYLLGVVAYRQGKLDEAEQSLKISLGLDARNARAHFSLGCVYNRRDEIDRARQEFLEAVADDPAYADAHYNLAVIYANQQDTSKAANHYHKAIENGSERDTSLEKVIGQPVGAR